MPNDRPVVVPAMLEGLEIGHQFDAPPVLGGFGAPVVWTVSRITPGVEYIFDLTCLGIALCRVVASVHAGDVIMEEV